MLNMLLPYFMSQRLCDLGHHEKYFYYMHKLIIESGKFVDPTYNKYYVKSFLGALPDFVEQYFKDKNISLE